MRDRRNPLYSFKTERALVRFFSEFLTKDVIRATMESVKDSFVARNDESSLDQKLQYLRKCESELVRMVQSRPE